MGGQFAHRDKTVYILKRLAKGYFQKARRRHRWRALCAVGWLRCRASGAMDYLSATLVTDTPKHPECKLTVVSLVILFLLQLIKNSICLFIY